MSRKKLPPRRPTQTFSFEHDGQKFHATVGYYEDDKPGELFLNSSQKSGSAMDISVSEAAIAVSLALQHGCKLRVLREAVQRRGNGAPSTPVGRALDIMDDEKPLKPRKELKLT